MNPFSMVPEAGFEPARSFGTRDFKSLASANSATPAYKYFFYIKNLLGFYSITKYYTV